MQKGFLLIWILVGVLAGGVILFTTIKLKPQPIPPPETSVIPAPAPVDETANWKTYVFSVSNPDSYSLKYPPDWKQNDQGNIVRFTSPPDSACIESPEVCEGDPGHYLEIKVVNIKNNITLESFINDYIKQNNLLYTTKLDNEFYRTIYDKNLKKLNLPTQNIDAIGVPGQCGAEYVFVLNNSKIYILNFECVEDEVFDQILYSFKFLE